MCTLRLTTSSRAALDLAAERTERSLAWLIGEAIADAATAMASAAGDKDLCDVLETHLASPRRADMARTTISLTAHADLLADKLAVLYTRMLSRPVSTAAIVRAAWMRWSDKGIEWIVRQIGAVRPGRSIPGQCRAQPSPADVPAELTISIAAATLLLSARADFAGKPFGASSIERFAHPNFRYSHRGTDSRFVTPDGAWAELAAGGHISGTREAWTPKAAGGVVA